MTVAEETKVEVWSKSFRVVSRSSNANRFGLHGHILVARDGEAWEVGRAVGPWLDEWPKGKDVILPYRVVDGHPSEDLVFPNCEIPRSLPKCPAGAVKELYEA